MGPVGAKTEEEEEGGCASNRPRNEREKEVGHPSPLDTRHLRARTRTLWLARVRANLGPSGSRGGWPPDWTNSSNRTYTRPLSLSLAPSLPPSLPERTLFNQPPRFDLVPVRESNGRLDSVCPSPIYLVRFTADFTVSDIRFQLISSPPRRVSG